MLVAAAACGLFNPTVTLGGSGKRATLMGKGPPVVFSTGLFGTSTWRMYSKLIKDLGANATIAVLNGPLTAADVDGVADAIGCDQVGFLAHSSFDPTILRSERVTRAVVLDPICVPGFDNVEAVAPTRVLRSGLLYAGNRLPDFNQLRVGGAVVDDLVFEGAGHTDLLDPWWADLAARTSVWDVATAPRRAFADWSRLSQSGSVEQVRQGYRAWIRDRTIEFIHSDPIDPADLPSAALTVPALADDEKDATLT
jgi:hypothetical protein